MIRADNQGTILPGSTGWSGLVLSVVFSTEGEKQQSHLNVFECYFLESKCLELFLRDVSFKCLLQDDFKFWEPDKFFPLLSG